jgi:DNA repair photolyase
MGLNLSRGNMYEFVTHTVNFISGECPHLCGYCYMHRWGKQKPVHFNAKELKTDLGTGNFIFVGSSCDMFADAIPENWIMDTLSHCRAFDNKYLFQTKNPARLYELIRLLPPKSVVCTTIETNRLYLDVMKNCPTPQRRALAMYAIQLPKYVTIEPIMDFDLDYMIELIRVCKPVQVNIGADSCKKGLVEPSREKLLQLIGNLQNITVIAQKKNLNRLLNK